MQRGLQRIRVLIATTLVIVCLSIYFDLGKLSWLWFQRSGAIVVLFGALLSYRSIVRMGRKGAGGAAVVVATSTVESVDESGPVQTLRIRHDPATLEKFRQDDLDEIAGYVGLWMMITGTLIWAYGDLLWTAIKLHR